jgi:hypothetical protein
MQFLGVEAVTTGFASVNRNVLHPVAYRPGERVAATDSTRSRSHCSTYSITGKQNTVISLSLSDLACGVIQTCGVHLLAVWKQEKMARPAQLLSGTARCHYGVSAEMYRTEWAAVIYWLVAVTVTAERMTDGHRRVHL